MPELPEVETVKNSILSQIGSEKIIKVEVNHSGVLKNCTAEEFCDFLEGRVVKTMERRGKYLIFILDNDKYIVAHLRMTGQLVYFEKTLPQINHCHVVIHFAKNGIYYRDVRRFGGFWIGDNLQNMGSGIEKLGPEPLTSEYNEAHLLAYTQKKHAPIKSILLDQSVVAGIGNIYADEICFTAGVNPLKEGLDLSTQDIKMLVKATKEVLTVAIEKRGTTFSDYRDGYGEKGTFQNYLKIFQRGGLPCVNCGSIIEKTKCGGRSTSYCPQCQPLKRKKIVIGLTGGIASGKTVASDYLHILGAEILDADLIAREIMAPNSTVINKIANTFGTEFINEDGTLNRILLRNNVFNHKEKVKELNAITHPAIRRIISSRIKKSQDALIILVAPLLIEAKYTALCDEVWLLYAGDENQKQRLLKRDGIDEELATKIMVNQMTYEKKAKFAQLIIDNSRTEMEMKNQIKEAFEKRKKFLDDKES
ncbi:MAG: bifunctional DNA-formamidopyrimidine glycosylase/DNA-(apurinic or apyrimidinic site) lyase [Clostridiales bacterium]